MAAFIWSKLQ